MSSVDSKSHFEPENGNSIPKEVQKNSLDNHFRLQKCSSKQQFIKCPLKTRSLWQQSHRQKKRVSQERKFQKGPQNHHLLYLRDHEIKLKSVSTQKMHKQNLKDQTKQSHQIPKFRFQKAKRKDNPLLLESTKNKLKKQRMSHHNTNNRTFHYQKIDQCGPRIDSEQLLHTDLNSKTQKYVCSKDNALSLWKIGTKMEIQSQSSEAKKHLSKKKPIGLEIESASIQNIQGELRGLLNSFGLEKMRNYTLKNLIRCIELENEYCHIPEKLENLGKRFNGVQGLQIGTSQKGDQPQQLNTESNKYALERNMTKFKRLTKDAQIISDGAKSLQKNAQNSSQTFFPFSTSNLLNKRQREINVLLKGCNESEAKIKMLKQQVLMLRKERVTFSKLYKNLEQEIHKSTSQFYRLLIENRNKLRIGVQVPIGSVEEKTNVIFIKEFEKQKFIENLFQPQTKEPKGQTCHNLDLQLHNLEQSVDPKIHFETSKAKKTTIRESQQPPESLVCRSNLSKGTKENKSEFKPKQPLDSSVKAQQNKLQIPKQYAAIKKTKLQKKASSFCWGHLEKRQSQVSQIDKVKSQIYSYESQMDRLAISLEISLPDSNCQVHYEKKLLSKPSFSKSHLNPFSTKTKVTAINYNDYLKVCDLIKQLFESTEVKNKRLDEILQLYDDKIAKIELANSSHNAVNVRDKERPVDSFSVEQNQQNDLSEVQSKEQLDPMEQNAELLQAIRLFVDESMIKTERCINYEESSKISGSDKDLAQYRSAFTFIDELCFFSKQEVEDSYSVLKNSSFLQVEKSRKKIAESQKAPQANKQSVQQLSLQGAFDPIKESALFSQKQALKTVFSSSSRNKNQESTKFPLKVQMGPTGCLKEPLPRIETDKLNQIINNMLILDSNEKAMSRADFEKEYHREMQSHSLENSFVRRDKSLFSSAYQSPVSRKKKTMLIRTKVN